MMRGSSFLTALLLLAGLALPVAAQPQILYYKFDETSGSEARNSAVPGQGWENGALTAAPTWDASTAVPALGPRSLNNTGLGRRMNTGYSISERNGQPFTIEFWFRTTGGGFQDFCNDSATFGVWLNNGRIQVQTPGGITVESTNTNNNDGTWRYAAVTRTAGGAYTLYWGTTAAGLTSDTGNNNGAFGANGFGLLYWQGVTPATYDGLMDEFRLWSGVRTQAELEADRFTPFISQDIDVYDPQGSYIKPGGTAAFTNVPAATFTDFTFSIQNVRTAGDVTFSPVTLAGIAGCTAAVLAHPGPISPAQTTNFTIRVTPIQPEFSFTVNVNNDSAPDPYAFTFSGMMNTGRPEMLYYRLNEGVGTTTRNDASPGRGNNPATFSVGPSWTGAGNARLGTNAVQNNSSLPTGFNCTQLPRPEFTLEFWYFRPNNSNATHTICGDGAAFRVYRQGNGANSTLRIQSGPANGDQNIDTGVSFTNNAWTHIAIVSEPGVAGLRVYKDGSATPSHENINYTFPFVNAPFTVFRNTGSGTQFAGRLDEFRFWAQARSAAQIGANMNNELTARLQVERPASTVIPSGGNDALGNITTGVTQNLSYTLRNAGNTGLLLGNPAASSSAVNNCVVNIVLNPSGALVAAAGTTTADVEVTPIAGGAFSCLLTFASNDPDTPNYTVTVSGTGVAGEIQLERPLGTIRADNSADALGTVAAGVQLPLTYTVRNVAGAGNIVLGLVTVNGIVNCGVIITQPALTTLAPGGSTTFQIDVTPTVAGAFSFALHLANDDANENPYDINVSGTAAAGEIQIERPLGTTRADGGNDPVGNMPAGVATALVYTVRNVSAAGDITLGLLTVNNFVNCSVVITQPALTTIAPGGSTTFQLDVTPTVAGAFSCSAHLVNNDSNENPYDINISGTGLAGEIQIERPLGTTRADGGNDPLGTIAAGVPTSFTYTVRNVAGANNIQLGLLTVNALVNCSVGINQPVAGTIGPGGSTTFQLDVTPTAAGVFSFALHLANNDGNENPYDINVSGTGAAGEIQIERPLGTTRADGGNDPLGNLPAGVATSLVYTVRNVSAAGDIVLGLLNVDTLVNCSVAVNQPLATTVLPGGSTTFQLDVTPTTGAAFSFALHLVNSDSNENPYDINASGTGLAGEIQLERPLGTIRADGSNDALGNVVSGVVTSLTYSVRNVAGANNIVLGLVTTDTLVNCSVIVTQPGLTTLAPGGSTTFQLDIMPTAPGAFSFNVHLANNDGNENPYDLTVSGNAQAGEIQLERPLGTTRTDGSTDAIGNAPVALVTVLTYTVRNVAVTGTLVLGVLTVDSLVNCGVVVTQPGLTSIAPGGSTTFQLDVTPTATGAFSFSLHLPNNDSNENPYDVNVSGTGVPTAEIDVQRPAAVSKADGAIDNVPGGVAGATSQYLYTVENVAAAGTLSLGALTFNNQFNCNVALVAPGTSSLGPGATTTFRVDVTPIAAGAFGVDVHLASDDTDENPYDILARGTAVVGGEIDVQRPAGAANSIPSGGSDPVVGGVAGVTVMRTYTIENQGTAALTVSSIGGNSPVNCFVAIFPPSLPAVLAASGSTTFDFQITPSAAGLFSFNITVGSDDLNENPYTITVSGTASAGGEIEVSRSGAIADGGSDALGGGHVAGVPIVLNYSVANNGTADLAITGVVISGQTNCTANVTLALPGTIVNGTPQTLQITVTPLAAGSFDFDIDINSDDQDENPYDIAVDGTAIPGGEIDVSRVGAIADGGSDALGGGHVAGVPIVLNYSVANNGTADLTITGVVISGQTNCTANVTLALPGTIVNGTPQTLQITVTPLAAGSFDFDFDINSDDQDENPYDIAVDGTASPGGEIGVERPAGTFIADGGSDPLGGGHIAGVPIVLTYMVHNTGSALLTFGATNLLNQTNCSANVTGALPASLPNSSSAALQITVTPTGAGNFDFDIEIVNDDTDENPYDIAVDGTAIPGGEIDVSRVGAIADGGADPLGGGHVAGIPIILDYTVANNGTADLAITGVVISGQTNCTANVTLALPGTIVNGTPQTLQITVTPLAAGSFDFDIDINSDDQDENPYDIAVDGTAIPGGEIDVSRVGAIADGGSDALGSGHVAGIPIILDYTVANSGSTDLAITGVSLTGQTNCTAVVTIGLSGTIVNGTPEVLRITVTPLAAGSFDFDIDINSDDQDENPYDIAVDGSADNRDIEIDQGGTGLSNPDTVNIAGSIVGVQQTLPFNIDNDGSALLTLTGAQRVQLMSSTGVAVIVNQPASATIAGGGAEAFSVDYTAAGLAAWNFVLRVESDDPADPVWDITVQDNAPTNRAIAIDQGGTPLAYPTGSVNVGVSFNGVQQNLPFNIDNNGTAALDLTGAPTVAVNSSSGVSLIVNLPAASNIGPGGNEGFGIDLTPTVSGAWSFQLQVDSNDPARPSWLIDVSGNSTNPPLLSVASPVIYGSWNVNTTSSPATVHSLSNTGGAALTITAINIIGGEWAFAGAAPGLPAVVFPAGAMPISLEFTPSALGPRIGQIEVISNTGGTAGTSTFIDLEGDGTTAAITSSTPVSYGTVAVGNTSAPVNHVIDNGTGTGQARINGITMSGPDQAAWTLDLSGLPSFPFNIAAGGNDSFSATFSPTGAAGHAAQIHILWDNGPGSPAQQFDIDVTGSGVPGSSVTNVQVGADNGGPIRVQGDVNGPAGLVDVTVTYSGGSNPGAAVISSAGSFTVAGNVILGVPVGTTLVFYWDAYATEGHTTANDYVITLSPEIAGVPGTPGSSAMFSLTRSGEWTKFVTPQDTQSAVSDHTMIHDVANDRLVLFGGYRATQLSNETWTYDHATGIWRRLQPAGTPPSARREVLSVYDAPRNRMIVFGGNTAAGNTNTTFALSLTPGAEAWTQIAMTAPLPAVRTHGTLIVDSANDRAILYGGYNSPTTYSDTWALDLATDSWGAGALATVGTPAGGSVTHSAVYDPLAQRMLMFRADYGQLWQLTLGVTPTWTNLTPGGTPNKRSRAVAVYDSTRHAIVLQGGANNTTTFAEAWSLDIAGMTWSQLPSEPGSPGRQWHAGVYDAGRDWLVVMGGKDFARLPNTSMGVLDLAVPAWLPAPDQTSDAAGPPARNSAVMCHDSTHNRVILYGGRSSAGNLGDLWQLDMAPGATWGRLTAAGPDPGARAYAASAYDATANRLIVFGGEGIGGRLNDLWTLDLTTATPTWTLWSTGTGPVGRTQSAIAYDSNLDRVLLFGGATTAQLGDFWTYDFGGGWSQPATTLTPPSARVGHGAAFDSVQNRFVVYCGRSGSSDLRTVHALDLGTLGWSDISSPGPVLPAGRSEFASAVNAAGTQAFLHAGRFSSGQHGDLWRLDLSGALASWTQLSAFTGAPLERHRGTGCLTSSGTMVVFGGTANKALTADTWGVDPAAATPTFTQLSVGDAPPNLAHAQSAFDPVGNRMIVFSGMVNGAQHSGLWQMDLSVSPPAWSRLNAAGPPPNPRVGASFVYDSSTSPPRILMYGGRKSASSWSTVNELWSLELTPGSEAWVQLNPTFAQNPGTRVWHQAVIDGSGHMVVFGGQNLYNWRLNDVYRLNLATLVWSRVTTAGTAPSPRNGHGMVYDGQGGRNRIVMFGGLADAGHMNDTWELDLSTNSWSTLSVAGTPPSARSAMSTVLDAATGRMLVYGGQNTIALGGLYGFDPGSDTWTQLATTGATPQDRWAHSAVWDSLLNRMVVVGGYGGYGGAVSNEVPLSEQDGAVADTWYWGD